MIEIQEFEVLLPSGETETYVSFVSGDGLTTMTKSLWDEQQAQKELGGTL